MARKTWARAVALAGLLAVTLAACGNDPGGQADDGGTATSLTVYSGREKDLVGPLFEQFEKQTGVTLNVRYGDSAALAAQLLEEGTNSPADVFFAQDAGALGAVAQDGKLIELPSALVERVAEGFRADDGRWVGVSGRARTLVYNTQSVTDAEIPASVLDLTDAKWKGKIGWAPTNASFQAFVTALRITKGEEAAKSWLEGVKANGAQTYEKNTAIVEGVGKGEIELGLVNHYYLYRLLKENPNLPAKNHFFRDGDPGALVNVAGVGVLESSKAKVTARRFVEFLVSRNAQQYFVTQTFEYPLATGVEADERLPKLSELEPPQIDLSKLADLEKTLALLKETGVLSA